MLLNLLLIFLILLKHACNALQIDIKILSNTFFLKKTMIQFFNQASGFIIFFSEM